MAITVSKRPIVKAEKKETATNPEGTAPEIQEHWCSLLDWVLGQLNEGHVRLLAGEKDVTTEWTAHLERASNISTEVVGILVDLTRLRLTVKAGAGSVPADVKKVAEALSGHGQSRSLLHKLSSRG
jgi:hypothetical protein